MEGLFMISVPKTSGVYILVFHLAKATGIAFDRKGTRHTFSPGWYLYVGSACGEGGLSRRLARHQRRIADDKKMNWNVDYFREHALLCEIWYCEMDDPRLEHSWAQTVAGLKGSTVPVPKFGANDCKADCPSHFFHLPERLSTAVFRSQMCSRELSTAVSVAFIAEPSGKKSQPATRSEYFLGRQFLERRNRAIRDNGEKPADWTRFEKCKPAKELAETVAKEMMVSYLKLREAIKFATAVETLIQNCGESAWYVLFDPKRTQTRKAIMSLSRTSDVRQRHRVKGVIDGRFRSIAPHSDDTVFDTVKYGEVTSRLARARGSLATLLEQLRMTNQNELRQEAKKLSRLCRLSAQRLDKCLGNQVASASAVPRYLGKETIIQVVKTKTVKGKVIGLARAALRFIVKNVWDFEEMMRRGLEPTAEQLEKTRSEIGWIREITSKIEHLGQKL